MIKKILIGLAIILGISALIYLSGIIALATLFLTIYSGYKVYSIYKNNDEEKNYIIEVKDRLYDTRLVLGISLSCLLIFTSISYAKSRDAYAIKRNNEYQEAKANLEEINKKSNELTKQKTKLENDLKNKDKKIQELELSLKEKEEVIKKENPTIGKAKVKETTDGDTIVVTLNNKDYKLRLIGVDTPETKHPNKGVEFMGQEAADFTAKELKEKEVWVEKDVSETDKYQRLLRYVWLVDPSDITNPTYEDIRDKTINGILVREGYAKASTYPPDVKYQEYFNKIQQEAEQNKKGLWQDKKENVEEETKKQDEATQTSETVDMRIKGNRNSMIYHFPGGRSYNKVKESNAVYFKTPQEAEAAGYRPAKR